MNKQQFEHIIQQHVTAFGIQKGECLACGSHGTVIPHVGRLGKKEYMLCEKCAHRVWLKRPQA